MAYKNVGPMGMIESLTYPKPKIHVVNNRLLCIKVLPEMVKTRKSHIITLSATTMADKAGNIRQVPRFFVAKTSPNLYLEDEFTGELPFGTEVFPFIPPAENFDFPKIYDYLVGEEYTMLEWPEITGYLLPSEGTIEIIEEVIEKKEEEEEKDSPEQKKDK